MGNRRLSADELQEAEALLEQVRTMLMQLAGTDDELHWALRRKVYKELVYDERGKPMHRRRLKRQKREQQGGLCAECEQPLPARYAVLDRHQAMRGYTVENTRLLCVECDTRVQGERGYR